MDYKLVQLRQVLYDSSMSIDTPLGTTTIPYKWVRAKVASSIYASAVWGYGLSGWLRRNDYTSPIQTLHKVQNRLVLSSTKIYDPYITNENIPWEYSTLDQWLEPLWQQTFINDNSSK